VEVVEVVEVEEVEEVAEDELDYSVIYMKINVLQLNSTQVMYLNSFSMRATANIYISRQYKVVVWI
jgi:hypothetical protein